ncbi:hypothetical protein [Streptomyces nigra]
MLTSSRRSPVRVLFLHVELAAVARGDGPDADDAAEALADTLATWERE